jgi:hypothetical protein
VTASRQRGGVLGVVSVAPGWLVPLGAGMVVSLRFLRRLLEDDEPLLVPERSDGFAAGSGATVLPDVDPGAALEGGVLVPVAPLPDEPVDEVPLDEVPLDEVPLDVVPLDVVPVAEGPVPVLPVP